MIKYEKKKYNMIRKKYEHDINTQISSRVDQLLPELTATRIIPLKG